MSYHTESDSLIRQSKSQIALDDDEMSDNDLRSKLSTEVFGALFLVLMKSTQVVYPLWSVVLYAIFETMQILSLLTHPSLGFSNALSGVVHDVLGITSFVSYHIYSSTLLFWITCGFVSVLILLTACLISLQSLFVKSSSLLFFVRSLFFLVCNVLFVPFVIQCISAITCRMDTTTDVSNYSYCWSSNASNANIFYNEPVVSGMVKVIMFVSVPLLFLHILISFLYVGFVYVDNPLDYYSEYSSSPHSRTFLLSRTYTLFVIISIYVLENYIPKQVVTSLVCIVLLSNAYAFIIDLPYYSYIVNQVYAALYILQSWIAVCVCLASYIDNPEDHTTSIIAYILSPVMIYLGVNLVELRKRQIVLRDSLELTRPNECELKCRFMLEDVTRDLQLASLTSEYLTTKPRHLSYLLRAAEWYTYACDRWPNDAALMLDAARFHAMYIKDTFSATRYGKNAKASQPSLDTLFGTYRLHQYVMHLYEEQHHHLVHIDTSVLNGTDVDVREQRKHRDLMLNVTLERATHDALNAEIRSCRSQIEFWEECGKPRPDLNRMIDLAYNVARSHERYISVSSKVAKMRSNMRKGNDELLRSRRAKLSKRESAREASSTTRASVDDDHGHDEYAQDVVLSGHIIVTLRSLGHIVRVDKSNPSSLSDTISLNMALAQLNNLHQETVTAQEISDAAESAAGLESAAVGAGIQTKNVKQVDETVRSIGGLRSFETGEDKRGYTLRDRVFADLSPFKLEELDDNIYAMFGYVPEDLYYAKIGTGTSKSVTHNVSMPTKASWATINALATEGIPIYNSSIFFFEPHRTEHLDFLRKYALLALYAAINEVHDQATSDDLVTTFTGNAPIERLLDSFNRTTILCQHSDGTVFPARIHIKPISHPNSPVSLMLTISKLHMPRKAALFITAPNGDIVTCSRNALQLFDPRQHVTMTTTSLPPILSQQLFALSTTSISDSVTFQMDLRAKRLAYSQQMNAYREALHAYLDNHCIQDWFPQYERHRHNIQSEGLTVRIALEPLPGTLLENAKGIESNNIITAKDGTKLRVVPITDKNLDECRLYCVEATLKVWISPLVNRSRIDNSPDTYIPTEIMLRSSHLPGATLPTVGTSTFHRRMAVLYAPTVGGDVANLLDLSPRTKFSYVPLSGVKKSGTGFIYEPSELVAPLDPDFYPKYRKKEQYMAKLCQETVEREQYLYASEADRRLAEMPSSRAFGTSSSRNNLPSSSRSSIGGSTGDMSARTPLSPRSGRLSARGKTKSLLDLNDDIDTAPPDQLLAQLPPTVAPTLHRTSSVAQHSLTRMATSSNLLTQHGDPYGRPNNSSNNSGRNNKSNSNSNSSSSSSSSKRRETIPIFPEYGDVVYFEVVSMHIPVLPENDIERSSIFNLDEIEVNADHLGMIGFPDQSGQNYLGEDDTTAPEQDMHINTSTMLSPQLPISGLVNYNEDDEEDADGAILPVATTNRSYAGSINGSHSTNSRDGEENSMDNDEDQLTSNLLASLSGRQHNSGTGAANKLSVPGAIDDELNSSENDDIVGGVIDIERAISVASSHRSHTSSRYGGTAVGQTLSITNESASKDEDSYSKLLVKSDHVSTQGSISSSSHSRTSTHSNAVANVPSGRDVHTELLSIPAPGSGLGDSKSLTNSSSLDHSTMTNTKINNATVFESRQERITWVTKHAQAHFSMASLERYDRYLRCIQFLRTKYNLHTPKSILYATPDDIYIVEDSPNTSSTTVSRPKPPANDSQLIDLYERITSKNEQSHSALNKYKVFFIISLVVVMALFIFQFLSYYLQADSFNDDVGSASHVVARDYAIAALGMNAFYINLVHGGYTPQANQGIGPFDVPTLKNHMNSLAGIIERGTREASKIDGSDRGNVEMYTSGSTSTTIHLAQALIDYTDHARQVIALPGTDSVTTNPSIYYLITNSLIFFLLAISNSSKVVVSNTQDIINDLRDWALYMFIGSVAALVVIGVFLLRPTVVYIRNIKQSLLSMYLQLPKESVLELQHSASVRLAALSGERQAISDSVEDLHAFHTTNKDRKRYSSSTREGSLHMYTLVMRVSLLVVVALVFFVVIYTAGYLPLKDNVQSSLLSLFDTSELSVATTKVASAIVVLAAQNANVKLDLPPVAQAGLTSTGVRHLVDLLERTHDKIVLYGDGAGPILTTMKRYHGIQELRDILFHDACTQNWIDDQLVPRIPTDGDYSFVDYLAVNNTRCTLFDEYSLGSGLQVATIEFIREARTILDQIDANTASTGANAGLVIDSMPHFEMFWRLLSTAQAKAIEYHRGYIRKELDDFISFTLIIFIVFSAVLLVVYFLFYAPIILSAENDFKSLRGMLLYIPTRVIHHTDAYQSWQ